MNIRVEVGETQNLIPIFEKIVRQGRYVVIDEYAFKKDLVKLMTGVFLQAIEVVCGPPH